MRVLLLFVVLLLTSLCQLPAQEQEQVRVVDVLDFGRPDVRNFVLCPASRHLFVSHTDDPNSNYDDRLYQWNIDTNKIEHVYRLGQGYMCDNLAPSPDCRFLVVGCWPLRGAGADCKVLLADTRSRQIAFDLQHKGRIFNVCYSADGGRFAISTSETQSPPSYRPLVYDTSGHQIPDADLAGFQPTKNPYVWYQAPVGKVDLKSGLYCKDATGTERKLDVDHWHDNYGATVDGRYIAASTWDGELIVWRRSDVKEVFRQRMARQYGYLRYDPVQNRFLWADATHGTSKLKAIIIEAPK